MGLRIDCKEDIHLSVLEACPTSVQMEFRDALAELKKSSVNDIKRVKFDFLSRIDGFSHYQIGVSNNGTEYAIIFEIKRTRPGEQNIIYILTIGERGNIIE